MIADFHCHKKLKYWTHQFGKDDSQLPDHRLDPFLVHPYHGDMIGLIQGHRLQKPEEYKFSNTEVGVSNIHISLFIYSNYYIIHEYVQMIDTFLRDLPQPS